MARECLELHAQSRICQRFAIPLQKRREFLFVATVYSILTRFKIRFKT